MSRAPSSPLGPPARSSPAASPLAPVAATSPFSGRCGGHALGTQRMLTTRPLANARAARWRQALSMRQIELRTLKHIMARVRESPRSRHRRPRFCEFLRRCWNSNAAVSAPKTGIGRSGRLHPWVAQTFQGHCHTSRMDKARHGIDGPPVRPIPHMSVSSPLLTPAMSEPSADRRALCAAIALRNIQLSG